MSFPQGTWHEVNPATTANLTTAFISAFTSNGYGLKELRTNAITLAIPAKKAVFGVSIRSFGYEAYREIRLMPALSYRFNFNSSRSMAVGISSTVNRINIQGIGSRVDLAFSAGIIAEIWPRVFIGASAKNWIKWDPQNPLEEEIRIGLGYRLLNKAWVLIAVQKSILYPLSLSVGLEHTLSQAFTLRSGVSTAPYRLALGIDLTTEKLTAGLLAEKHIFLNWTPALAIGLHI
ncbi:MAG: hypothetical protein KTR29_16625 [Rhodothermaceae bacterium]|nr:hypothetical protein [Rhodothermaceae bacterium]